MAWFPRPLTRQWTRHSRPLNLFFANRILPAYIVKLFRGSQEKRMIGTSCQTSDRGIGVHIQVKVAEQHRIDVIIIKTHKEGLGGAPAWRILKQLASHPPNAESRGDSRVHKGKR
jgi:hypothetical protein